MFNPLELLILAASLAAAGLFLRALPRSIQAGAIAAAFVTVALSVFQQPAIAAAANPKTLDQGKQELHETLKTTPEGSQYQGIEYPHVTGEPLSDRQITRKIRSDIPDHLKLSVSSGSVRLSGQVSDRKEAQKIVQTIKEIPGVHEISYDLGLNKKA